jgi:hypothetical protein
MCFVLYNPKPVNHMSIWVLLCIYIVEVCFLWITWICGPKARTFLVVLSLTSDALFWRVSVTSVFGRRMNPRILLRFQPVIFFLLLMVTCGQVIRFMVNITCTDFAWFILIFHLLYHCWRRFRWCWSCRDATIGSLFASSRAVSSA